MTICYYITGHGYGHAIRSSLILKALPPNVRVILKTSVPERLFHEELPNRAFAYMNAEYDCGCIQRDSVTVLPQETLVRYREIAGRNHANLRSEVAYLRDEGVRCVVSDIAAFPLYAAREAGIPGVAVANFTWHDIYREYCQCQDDADLHDRMAAEYGAATLALITPLSTPTVAAPFPNVARVPLVARKGTGIRSELVEALAREAPGLMGAPDKHLAFLYIGSWGMAIDWAAVAKLEDWIFLSYDTPAQTAPNVVTLRQSRWSVADVAASVDAVVSKAGYGTVTECIANGTPLVYVPRAGFSEYASLVSGMMAWGGGIEIRESAYLAGHWGAALAAALAARPNSQIYQTNGADVIAGRLMAYCR